MEVKIWSLCSVSSTLSHANLTNKVRGKYNCKEVFPRLYLASFLPAFSFLHLNCYCVRRLFMRLSLMLCHCDAEWWCRWLYNMWIELPWPENPANSYAWHTETLDSCFDLIMYHQQCTPCSTPLEIESATTDSRGETLQLNYQLVSHTSDAKLTNRNCATN